MASSLDPGTVVDRVAEPEGIATLVGRLVDDGRSLVSAEVNLAKARMAARVGAYRTAVVFFAAAAVLGLSAFIALLVGLIFTLTPVTGPLLATVIVVGVILLIALVLALIGKAKLTPAEPTA